MIHMEVQKMYEYKCRCGLSIRLHLDDSYEDSKEEKRLKKEIENEELGVKYKKLLNKYPNGYIDTHRELYKCSNCGEWVESSIKDFYKPIALDEATCKDSIIFRTLGAYQRISKYRHICKKCGARVSAVPHNKLFNEKFRCFRCGKENHLYYYTNENT